MKQTIFHDIHVGLGAKMGPFGGFNMPIQYEGIIAEHLYTRSAASLFDTCHMGEFIIEGAAACSDLERILSCDVSSLQNGRCKYGFICNQIGGVIDDQIIYRISDNSFFMVVNASTADADFAWLQQQCSATTILKNISEETAKIDLQGPGSIAIINKLLGKKILDLSYYSFTYVDYKGKPALVSRTGYTGELGIEIYLDAPRALRFWSECMALEAKPAGLGARDTLRLEMGFPLYGHELDATRNAAESGFTQAISCKKQFIGSSALCHTNAAQRMLTGIQLSGRRAARAGDDVFDAGGQRIGTITSGSFTPSLGSAIALAYVDCAKRQPGFTISAGNDRYRLDGVIASTPFYKHSTARKKISDYL